LRIPFTLKNKTPTGRREGRAHGPVGVIADCLVTVMQRKPHATSRDFLLSSISISYGHVKNLRFAPAQLSRELWLFFVQCSRD